MGMALALGAAVAVTGCQVTNTPTGYQTPEAGTIVQTNFVDACTGNLPSEAGTTTILAPKNKCECQFQVYMTSVPFDDADRPNKQGYPSDAPTFVSLENDLRNSPGDISKLPSTIQDNLKACGNEATVGTTAR